jgi:hypothetical protein
MIWPFSTDHEYDVYVPSTLAVPDAPFSHSDAGATWITGGGMVRMGTLFDAEDVQPLPSATVTDTCTGVDDVAENDTVDWFAWPMIWPFSTDQEYDVYVPSTLAVPDAPFSHSDAGATSMTGGGMVRMGTLFDAEDVQPLPSATVTDTCTGVDDVAENDTVDWFAGPMIWPFSTDHEYDVYMPSRLAVPDAPFSHSDAGATTITGGGMVRMGTLSDAEDVQPLPSATVTDTCTGADDVA